MSTSNLLDDILSSVLLDVRQHEATLLSEKEALERENKALRKWKERYQSQAFSFEAKRVQLQQDHMLLDQKRQALEKKERVLTRQRLKSSTITSRPRVKASNENIPSLNNKPKKQRERKEDPKGQMGTTSLLEYMTRCEEMIGQAHKAAEARKGLDEQSKLEDVLAVVPRHLDELESALEERMERIQAEIHSLRRQSENKEESKTSNAAAAWRIREKKAQREKKELVEALVAIAALCTEWKSANTLDQGHIQTEIDHIVQSNLAKFAS